MFAVNLGGPDTDGDGAVDAAEFRAGTDPANTGSVFRVLSLSTINAPGPISRSTTLVWSTVPGRTYRVQFKDGLDAPWQDLPGDVIAAGASATRNETLLAGSPPAPRRFYRVRLVD